jgi:hypothetical protein
MKNQLPLLIALCIILITGCSTVGNELIQPTLFNSTEIPVLARPNRQILGSYLVSLDLCTGNTRVIPNRTLQTHTSYNFSDTTSVNIDVDYDNTTIEDQFPTDYDYHFWTWRCNISLENLTNSTFYDVRGVVDVNGATTGVRNADARTSFYHTVLNGETPENPFKYFGDIAPDNSETKEYFINWAPIIDSLSCSNPQPATIPNPVTVEFILIIDTSDGPCLDPYAIENFSHTEIPSDSSNPEVTFSVDVLDHQNDISHVYIFWDGFNTNPEELSYVSGNTWTLTTDNYIVFNHEEVQYAGIKAVSGNISGVDAKYNPDYITEDVLVKIGDIDGMVDQLFAEPTTQEINTVLDDWDDRDTVLSYSGGPYPSFIDSPIGYGPGEYPTLQETGTYYLINHTIQDHESQNVGIQYGVVRIPNCDPPNGLNTPWPVLVYCHAGNFIKPNTPHNETLMGIPLASPIDYRNKFIILFPSYRGNTVCFDGDAYTSSFNNSPADWDVDDVIAFVERVLDDEFFADSIDTSSICIAGGSRGGSPALLAKIRDPFNRFCMATILCGSVASFQAIPGQEDETDYLVDQTRIYANELFYGYTESGPHYKKPYNECHNIMTEIVGKIYDGTMDIDEARIRMLRSSPHYFISGNNLAVLQVHHGSQDGYVNPTQISIFENDLSGVDYNFITYSGARHAIGENEIGSNNGTYWANLRYYYNDVIF